MESLGSTKTAATKQEKIKVIYESRYQYPLKEMLSFFKVSKSTYFYTINTYSREDKDYELKELIKAIFNKDKSRYGYR